MKVISITHLRYPCVKATANKVAFGRQVFSLGDQSREKIAILGKEIKTVGAIKRDGLEVFENGGVTRVVIEDEGGKTSHGEAYCNLTDRFCKATGVEIALGRAKKNLTKRCQNV